MRTEDIFTLMSVEEFASHLETFRFTRPVSRIQNHHTWIPNYSHFNGHNHFERLRSMRHSHIVDRGWSEIGQNITTFPDGSIAICRPLNTVPACIKGANTGSIGMEHLGNFDIGGDTQDPQYRTHQATIIAVNALFCRKLKLIPSTNSIVYHHWYDLNTGVRTNGTGSTKSCPGTDFFGGNTVEACAANFIPAVKAWAGVAQVTEVPQSTRSGEVNTNRLNIRGVPSITGPILGALQRGDRVDLYDRSVSADGSAWLRIDPLASKWVAERFIAN
jgi:hypothetical protein